MSDALAEIHNVTHRFGSHVALKDVSLTIARGSYTVLLGPSGSGKTTLLSILGGFVVPTAGQVVIDGKDCTAMPPAKRPTTTVFQDYALFPHMSVGANVAFGLRMRGVDNATRTRQAREVLAMVGLADAFDRKPHQLSGGQRQRVALARALVVEPAILLLDEPLGALDLKLRRLMQDELKAIQKRIGTAFVHVTHDQEEAMALADHCVVMNDGRIEDEGPAERVYGRPQTRFSASFMGESTLIAGTVTASTPLTCTIDTPVGQINIAGSPRAGSAVTLAIRPEHLRFAAQPNLPATSSPDSTTVSLGDATVTETVFQGSFKRALATSTADPALGFIAKLPAGSALRPGDRVAVSCDVADLILLMN